MKNFKKFVSKFKSKKTKNIKNLDILQSTFDIDFQSEKKYKELTDALPQIIFQTDQNRDLTFLNENALSLFGYTDSDFNHGLSLYNLFASSELSTLKKSIHKIFIKKESLYKEFLVKKKTGATFSVLAHIVPKIRNNKIVGLRGVMMNISKQKRIEELLKDSERKYRTMIEYSSDFIWTLDRNGNFTYLNQVAKKISGYQTNEIIGNNFSSLLFKEDKQRVLKIFQKTISGVAQHYEIKVRRKNSSIFILSVNTAPIFEGKKIIGTVSFAQDITEKENYLEKLHEEHEFRKTIESSSLAGIAIIDQNQQLISVNPAFCKMIGWKKEEILGRKPPMPYWHPDDIDQYSNRLSELTKNNINNPAYEYRFVKKNGEVINVRVLHSPLKNKKGEITHYLGLFDDFTKRRKEKYKLLKMKKAVDYSDEIIFTTDINGKFEYINAKFTKVYGYGAEIIGKNTPRIIKSDRVAKENYKKFWKNILAKEIVKGNILNKTKDGRIINLQSSVNPILDEKQNIIGFLCIQYQVNEINI